MPQYGYKDNLEKISVASSEELSAKYTKPNTGIPASDLSSEVQQSITKADSSYTKPASGIPASDLASGVVNNATITIKKNDGTTVDSFTVNQSNNKDITLPESGKVDDVQINGTTIVSNKIANITKTGLGLDQVGNFKAVSTVASQGLTDTEKSNARTNIAAIANAGTPLNCTLPTTGWDNNSITVSCSGLISTDNVMVSPAPSSFTEYSSCGIYCSAIGTDTATFIRSKENENSLTVNIYKLA